MFLKSPPSPSDRARTLTQQVDKHDGADVEWWRFAELAVRHHDNTTWIAERHKLEDKIKNRARWALGALIANLALVITTVGHFLVEEGRAEERDAQRDHQFLEYRDSQRREVDDLRQNIRDLRHELLRRLGDADKPDGSAMLGATTPFIPTGCGAFCTSQSDCSDFTTSCRYCNNRACSDLLPAQPSDVPDAGVDAPTGTKP